MTLMKKLICITLSVLMVFAFTACGKKTQTAVLTYEANGISIEYQLEATEDIVEKITQISTTSNSTDMSSSASSYQSLYSNIEGVTYSTEVVDDQFVETIVIDATNTVALQTLSEQGLLTIDGTSSTISFQKTVDNLTAQGWTIQE